jgi:hypothetical protein
MQKLDRLGWAEGFSFKSFGLRVGVRVNDSGVVGELKKRLPPGSEHIESEFVDHLYSIIIGGNSPKSRVRRYNIVYWDASRVARSIDLEPVLDAFESNLQLTVAEFSPRRVFVHAGVVEWNGKAIMIPGLSFSGKTTLVRHLVQAGAKYYSDEYAVLDGRGRVHPYPRPLGVRSTDAARTDKVPVEDLGGLAGSGPLPVKLVISTSYKEGAMWRPRELSAGKGVLELLSHTVSARRRPWLALTTLPKVAVHATILKGVRGEASSIAHAILEKMA